MNKLKSLLEIGGILGLGATIIFLLIVGPLCLIWGLNLLGFDIEYSFGSLFGGFLVMLVLRGGGSNPKK